MSQYFNVNFFVDSMIFTLIPDLQIFLTDSITTEFVSLKTHCKKEKKN